MGTTNLAKRAMSGTDFVLRDFPPGLFTVEEKRRLLWLRGHMSDIGEKREELSIVGRLYFARWLVVHGRVSEFA